MVDLEVTRIPHEIEDYQRRGLESATKLYGERGERDPKHCPVIITRGKGYYARYVGQQCRKSAGQGSWHEGFGRCVAHGGAKREGRAEGAWLMAFAYAEEYDLSPWESLLYVIRITAGRVRYCEQVLAMAKDDRELEGTMPEGEVTGVIVGGAEDGKVTTGRNLGWWVDTSERERVLLAKVSKAAIDAGVAQLLVEQTLREGNQLADSHLAVWHAMKDRGASKEVLDMLLEEMKLQLAALDHSSGGSGSVGGGKTIEGKILPPGPTG